MMLLETHQEPQTVKSKPPLYKVPSGCHSGPSLCSAQKQLSVHVGPLPSLGEWPGMTVLCSLLGSKGLRAPEVQGTGSVRSSEEHQEVRFNKEGRTLIATQGHSKVGKSSCFPFRFGNKVINEGNIKAEPS